MLALVDAQTTNLKKIAQKFKGRAQIDSHYKRIQRFLRGFELDFSLFARFLCSWMPFEDKWILCLDRTNWKLGQQNINILVLGVAYKGICIPLFCSSLSKRGNSNTEERLELLQRFLTTFGKDRIACLTADREFIGGEWIQALLKSGIPFRIRVKKNTQVRSARSHQQMALYKLFRGLKVQQSMVLNKKRKVWGMDLFVVGLRTTEEYVLLITNHQPHKALEDYKRRWEIETLFGCLKSRGFDFEETHLTKPERVEKLVVLLTLTLCWCIRYGELLTRQKKIPLKNHGRPAKSIFRKGLEELANVLANIPYKFGAFKRAVKLLSCT